MLLTAGPASADVPADRTIGQLADRYLEVRNSQLVTGAPAAGPEPDRQSPGFAARENVELAELRARRARLSASGERYTAARTDVTVLGTSVVGDELVARIQERTELDYARVHGDEPAYTAFVSNHVFTLRHVGGQWLLDDVALEDPAAVPPVNEVIGAGDSDRAISVSDREEVSTQRPTGRERRLNDKMPSEGTATIAAYNYTAMADYAKRYWSNYNTAYRAYTNDCTNFISQAMRAGGWGFVGSGYWDRTDNSKWYYGSYTWTTSYSWAGAENWYWFARNSGRTYGLSSVWYMGLADVLQIDFDRNGNIDHTMIVTKVDLAGQRYMTYHTNNTLNRSLSSILDSYPTAWYYAHRT